MICCGAMRKRSAIPGVMTLIFSAVLFAVVLPASYDAGLSLYMFYIVTIFTLLGIISGISVGKKMAYTMHDRELMAERLGGNGAITGSFGLAADISLLIGAFFIVGWTVFTVFLSLLEGAVADRILLGYVRYLSLLSMTTLITGSYLFFRAKSSVRDKMLSFWGKKAEMPAGMVEKMERGADYMEAQARTLPGNGLQMAAEAADMAENMFSGR